jgi:transcriptional regulator with XRE-family HTH domain
MEKTFKNPHETFKVYTSHVRNSARDKDKEEVARITRALKTVVQLRTVPHRYIEHQMGLSTGYLSRIFSGKVVLRMEHILGVCRAVEIPPGGFFEAVYPPEEYDDYMEGLIGALQELLPGEEKIRRTKKVKRKLGALEEEFAKPLAEAVSFRDSNAQIRRLAEALLEEIKYFDEKKKPA